MSEYNEFAVTQRYGQVPNKEQAIGYLKALKIIIGADGEIAPDEQKAFDLLMQNMGAASNVIDEIAAFNLDAKLEDVLSAMKKGGKRAKMLLRDAVMISRADGVYAKEEQEAVEKTAAILGFDLYFVRAIEALVEMEESVAKLHNALLKKN